MRRRWIAAIYLALAASLAACAGGQASLGDTSKTWDSRSAQQTTTAPGPIVQIENASIREEAEQSMHMDVQVGGQHFTATLEDNGAAEALAEMLEKGPVVIAMRDYGGFEKVGDLGVSLPASDTPTTAQAGDIVLYSGDQIVVFYGSNAWNYTRLGKIDNLDGWDRALGSGDVTLTFALTE